MTKCLRNATPRMRAVPIVLFLVPMIAGGCDAPATEVLSPAAPEFRQLSGTGVSTRFSGSHAALPTVDVSASLLPNAGASNETPYFTYLRPLLESRGTFFFEQLSANNPVTTPHALGVTFPGWLAVIDADDVPPGGNVGDGNFANEPSPKTAIFWASAATPNYWTRTSRQIHFERPVREIGFHYAVCLAICRTFGRFGVPPSEPFVIEVLGQSGEVLASESVGQNASRDVPGDPTGTFNVFTPLAIGFTENVIHAVRITGYDNLIAIDDFVFVRKNTEPVVNGGTPPTSFEGMGIALNGALSFDREDPIDSLTFAWTLPDATPATSWGTSVTATWPDDGTYNVTLRVTDPNGAFAEQVVAVTVENAAPTPQIVAPATIAGGVAFAPVTSFTDPGSTDQPWTYRAEWGDGAIEIGTATAIGNILLTPHVYGAPGDYVFTLAVEDNGGAEGVATHTVRVGNRAPLAVLAAPAAASEGAVVEFDAGASSDPDGQAIEYAWDFGDGTTTAFGAPVSVQHTYADGDADGSTYTVTLQVRDSFGDIATATAVIAVQNAAPVVQPIAGGAGVEGAPFALNSSVTFTDAGALDAPWTVAIDWGDGSTETVARATQGAFTAPTHTYATSGTFTIAITVTDRDGALSNLVGASAAIAPPNTPPVIHALNGPAIITEGGSAGFSVVASDPDGQPLVITWYVDGVPVGTGASMTQFFPDGPATGEVRVTVSDGVFTVEQTHTIAVLNVAPVVDGFAGGSLHTGGSFTIGTAFTDASAVDGPWDVTFDWGDGQTSELTVAARGALPAMTHVYAVAGSYNASVVVRDRDGEAGSASATVDVAPPLEVTIRITPQKIELESPAKRAAQGAADDQGGVVQAHVSSSGAFDARRIDWSTVTLGDGEGTDTPVAVKNNGQLHVAGGRNAVAHFYRLEMFRNGDLDPGDEVTLVLRGQLDDGTPFAGYDTVRID